MASYSHCGEETNTRLLHVLSDLVKTFLDTEQEIRRHLEQLGLEGRRSLSRSPSEKDHHKADDTVQGLPSLDDTMQGLYSLERNSSQGEVTDLCEDGPDLTPNCTADSIFYSSSSTSTLTSSVEDDVVLGASRRLRAAVDRVLKLLNQVVFSNQDYDVHSLIKRNEELEARVDQLWNERNEALESKAKEAEDFMLRIEANEKKLASCKKFIDEQTAERELEREEFQKSLDAANNIIKEKEKNEAKLRGQLEAIETQVNHLTEEKSSLENEIKDMQQQLKMATDMIEELRQTINQMEKDADASHNAKNELQRKVNGLSEALQEQVRINEELVQNQQSVDSSLIESITEKTERVSEVLSDVEDDGHCSSLKQSLNTNECAFNDAQQLAYKLSALNTCVDKLLIQNKNLKKQIAKLKSGPTVAAEGNGDIHSTDDGANQEREALARNYSELAERIEALEAEKDQIEKNWADAVRTNEILQQELSAKHLQLSCLRSRLENTLSDNSLQQAVVDYHNKLEAEKSNHKGTRRQLEEAENKIQELEERILTFDRVIREKEEVLHEAFKQASEIQEKLKTEKMHSQELQHRLQDAQAKIEILESQVEHKDTASSQASSEVTTLRNKLEAERTRNEAEQLRIKELEGKIQILESQLAGSEKKLTEKIGTIRDSLHKIVDDLQGKLEAEKVKYREESEKLKDAHGQIRLLQAKLETSEAKVHERSLINDQMFENLKKEIESERRKCENLQAEIREHKQKYTTKEGQAAQLVNEICTIQQSLNEAREAKASLQEENRKLHKEIDALREKVHEMITQTNATEEQFNEKAQGILRENLDLEKLLDASQKRVKSLEQELRLSTRMLSDLKEHHNKGSQDILRLSSENEAQRQRIMEMDAKIGMLEAQLESNEDKLKEKTATILSLRMKLNSQPSSLKSDHRQLSNIGSDCPEYKSLYWRMRRCESQKKALVYQKKYLLHVLEGFQLTEKATLAILASMNVPVDEKSSKMKPLNKFRTAVYSVIAISRMKYLVRIWKARRSVAAAGIIPTKYISSVPIVNGHGNGNGNLRKDSMSSSDSVHDMNGYGARLSDQQAVLSRGHQSHNGHSSVSENGKFNTLLPTPSPSTSESNTNEPSLEDFLIRLQQLHQTLGIRK